MTLALAATTALTLSAGAAAAQSWMPIDARQAMLDQRIDAGVRSGDLSRAEAMRLRGEFNALASLEDRYRASDGLSAWERSDLDRRFDMLSQQIRFERADPDRSAYRDRSFARNWYGGNNWTDNTGRWVPIDLRKMQLDRRIDRGLRSGQLTRAEAARLRAEFDAISRIEYRYRATNGLSGWERADLDRRFDQLAAQIRFERTDRDRTYGYNDYPRY
jgi:hypothetical protein